LMFQRRVLLINFIKKNISWIKMKNIEI
jgi:hypothetical protein